MFRPEPSDIVIILLVAMLLFGANRMPESARAIGKSIREFRDAVTVATPSSSILNTRQIRSYWEMSSTKIVATESFTPVTLATC
jgi:sec-independent protein translocase protein TatA